MSLISSLLVKLGMNTTGFDKGTKRGKKGLHALTKQSVRTQKAMLGLARGALAAAGVVGIGALVKKTMQSIDQVAKMSDELNISTEALKGLEHGAILSGASMSDLYKGLQIFVRRLGEAEQGIGEARHGLEALGVSADKIVKLGTEKGFLFIAEQISQIESATKRAQIAYSLFGRQGVNLVNLFMQGSKGIEAMQKEAEKLGKTFSRLDAAKVEEANDAIAKLRGSFEGMLQTAVIELAPFIEGVAVKLTEMGNAGGSAGDLIVDSLEKIAVSSAFTADTLWRVTDAARGVKTLLDEAGGAVLRGVGKLSGKEYSDKFGDAFGAFLEEGESPVEKIKSYFNEIRKIKTVGERSLIKMADPFQKDTGFLEAIATIDKLNNALNRELEITGRLNDTRFRSKDIVNLQTAAEKAFGANSEKTISILAEYSDKLGQLEKAQRLSDIAKSIGTSFANAFSEMVFGAQKASDAIRALAKDIAKMMIQKTVTEPLSTAITAGFSGLFGATTAKVPAGQMAQVASAGQNWLGADVMHGGGIAGMAGPTRRMPAMAFAGAPRLHNGLASDEFPAVLQRGEAVIPRGGGRASAPPSVVINNNTGQAMTQQGAPRFDGVNWVVSIVADNLDRGGVLRNKIKGLRTG